MSDKFKIIQDMYEESFKLHGDSPSALLTPKGRQSLRFRAIDEFLTGPKKSVLDYGCGLGYLLDYILKNKLNANYSGMDITESFIRLCNEKHKNNGSFYLVDPVKEIDKKFDIVFCSGVFNIMLGDSEEESKKYTFNKIKNLFLNTNDVFICDFLSPYVDYKQSNSLHFTLEEIADFCVKNLSRKFEIKHSLLPYEYTVIVYKNDLIQRPENFYSSDINFCKED